MWQIIATVCMITNPDDCVEKSYGKTLTEYQCKDRIKELTKIIHWYEPGYPTHVEGSNIKIECKR